MHHESRIEKDGGICDTCDVPEILIEAQRGGELERERTTKCRYRHKHNKMPKFVWSGKNRFERTRPCIAVVIVVYSLQKGINYYTRWRKYASAQKLTSSPLTVRVYALSTFADTTRLMPFGCNFLNACKPSGSKASAFHLASIARGAFSSPSITKSTSCPCLSRQCMISLCCVTAAISLSTKCPHIKPFSFGGISCSP